MQSIDTTAIDEISKKFGRKKGLKFSKYGYDSALDLLLSIEGFYKPKGMANPNAIIYKEGNRNFYKKEKSVDENNNSVEKPIYYQKPPVDPVEQAYTQAIDNMSKLLYQCGPEFYKQTLQAMVKFTDNTLLSENNKTVNFSSKHVDIMRRSFNRQACLAKVPSFTTIEFLVKKAVNMQPSKQCRLDDLNALYLLQANEILSSTNATSSPPGLAEIMKKVGLSCLKELVESFSDVVVINDTVKFRK